MTQTALADSALVKFSSEVVRGRPIAVET